MYQCNKRSQTGTRVSLTTAGFIHEILQEREEQARAEAERVTAVSDPTRESTPHNDPSSTGDGTGNGMVVPVNVAGTAADMSGTGADRGGTDVSPANTEQAGAAQAIEAERIEAERLELQRLQGMLRGCTRMLQKEPSRSWEASNQSWTCHVAASSYIIDLCCCVSIYVVRS